MFNHEFNIKFTLKSHGLLLDLGEYPRYITEREGD